MTHISCCFEIAFGLKRIDGNKCVRACNEKAIIIFWNTLRTENKLPYFCRNALTMSETLILRQFDYFLSSSYLTFKILNRLDKPDKLWNPLSAISELYQRLHLLLEISFLCPSKNIVDFNFQNAWTDRRSSSTAFQLPRNVQHDGIVASVIHDFIRGILGR